MLDIINVVVFKIDRTVKFFVTDSCYIKFLSVFIKFIYNND